MEHHKYFYFFCVSLILILHSCLRSETKIFLDQSTSFQIPENSKNIKIIQADVDFYQKLTNQSFSNQLILYKFVQGIENQMYIGVAIDITNNEIYQQLISNPSYKLLDAKVTDFDSQAILIQIDSTQFCYHYIKQFKKGDRYLFSILTKNKKLLEEIYNLNSIENSYIDD